MATQVQDLTNLNTSISEVNSFPVTSLGTQADFINMFKNKRDNLIIGNKTTQYMANFVLVKTDAANAVVITDSAIKNVNTNKISINVSAIKAAVDATKTTPPPSPSPPTLANIKDAIKAAIETFKTNTKTATEQIDTKNQATFSDKLSTIYANQSAIKIYTIVYVYVVLFEKSGGGIVPPPPPSPDTGICKELFGTDIGTDKCTNPFSGDPGKKLILQLNAVTPVVALPPGVDFVTKVEAAAGTEIDKLKTSNDALVDAIKSKLKDDADANANAKLIVALLRRMQYLEATQGSAPGPTGNCDDIVKYLLTVFPMFSAMVDPDITAVENNIKAQ